MKESSYNRLFLSLSLLYSFLKKTNLFLLTSHRVPDENDRSLPDAAFLQLLQDVFASVHQARFEALLRARVAPLRDGCIEVDPDDSNPVPHHAVSLQPIARPAEAVVVGAIK
jgi:hypothetical protein